MQLLSFVLARWLLLRHFASTHTSSANTNTPANTNTNTFVGLDPLVVCDRLVARYLWFVLRPFAIGVIVLLLYWSRLGNSAYFIYSDIVQAFSKG